MPKRVTDTAGPLENMCQCHALSPLDVMVKRMYEGGLMLAERGDFLMVLSFMTCMYMVFCVRLLVCAYT